MALEIAAAYVRVSTDDQTELSPDAQIREILKTAKADGYVIPKEFIFSEKRGISGRKADNRPEFQRMIATAKQTPAPFSRLYLWKFSRFARNQDESTFYKGILRKKCGVDIISVSEPIAQGMFGRLIETIIEWFDEYYSYNLSGEVIRGMTEKALQAGYQCTPCLGYAAVGNGKPYAIVDAEIRIVEQIFQMYSVDGIDKTGIARRLNDQGLHTKRGGLFDQRAIQRILTNRFYIGEVSWKGITFQGSHETSQSIKEHFEACQKRIEKEYHPVKRRNVSTCRHWASGLLKCSVCGSSMSYNGGGSARPSAVFSCWKYAKGFHKESCSVTVAKVERTIIHSLEDIIATGEITYEYIPQKTAPAEDFQTTFLEERLKKVDIKESRVRAAYENGIDTLEEYKANRARLREERDEIQKELATFSASDPGEAPPSKEEILSQIHDVCSLLKNPDIDFERKGIAIRSILKEIIFDRKTDHFEFHYYA